VDRKGNRRIRQSLVTEGRDHMDDRGQEQQSCYQQV